MDGKRYDRAELLQFSRSWLEARRVSGRGSACRTNPRLAALRVVRLSSRSEEPPLVEERPGFEEFVATNQRPLRQALTAACGIDHRREVTADALAYAWEHWDRVGAMANPAGYLFVVGRDRRCGDAGPIAR